LDRQAEAANLYFQLEPSRYERAPLIITSNKPFGLVGQVFGDASAASPRPQPTLLQRLAGTPADD